MERLFDAELKLMDVVWEHEPVSAKEISLLTLDKYGWNKNTTYTVIKRLIEKEVLRREEPGFICSAVLKRNDVQKTEIKTLIERLFGDSKKAFFSSFTDEKLTPDEVEALKALIDRED